MAYQVKSVTIRTNNTNEGMKKIDELWTDITSGKVPLLLDSEGKFQQGISPVSKYSNYASDEYGDYDLSIIGVTADFFNDMEKAVAGGEYIKYDMSGNSLSECTKLAWDKVWKEQKEGVIHRAFSEDYESTVPSEYTKDGLCHCYLYIAIQ